MGTRFPSTWYRSFFLPARSLGSLNLISLARSLKGIRRMKGKMSPTPFVPHYPGETSQALNLPIVECPRGRESAAVHREQCPGRMISRKNNIDDGKTRGTAAGSALTPLTHDDGDRAPKDLEEGTGTPRAPRQGEPESRVSLSLTFLPRRQRTRELIAIVVKHPATRDLWVESSRFTIGELCTRENLHRDLRGTIEEYTRGVRVKKWNERNSCFFHISVR